MKRERKLVVQFMDDFDHDSDDATKAVGVHVVDKDAFADACFEIMNGAFEKKSISAAVEIFDDWDVPVRMKLLLLLKHIEDLDNEIAKKSINQYSFNCSFESP